MEPKFDPSLLPSSPDFSFELPFGEHGCQYVAGVDEAGRGLGRNIPSRIV